MNDKILTQGEKAFRISEIHKSRTHLTRLAAVLLVMIGVQSVWAAKYVLTYTTNGTTYYLARNGTNGVVSANSFNPTTCIWTCSENTTGTTENTLGTSGNRYLFQTVDGIKYFLNYNLGLTATTANDYCRVRNSDYGVYFRSSTRYILLSTNGTVSYGNNNSTGRVTRYEVTTSTIETTSTNPTISGPDVLTITGNTTYTSTGAVYRIGYTNYRFNDTDHFFSGNTAITPANATLTNAWSLESNSYATVNNSGVVTVSSLPESDVTLTLTVTASVTGGNPVAPDGTTLTGTKEITIQGTKPSAPTISVSGTTVTMSTTAVGSTTIRYTLDGTEPTASTGTEYSGPIDLSSSTTSPVTIKAVTVRNGNASDVATQDVTLTLPAPTITANASAGTATIACAIAGTTIYYTTDDSEPTTSSTQYTGELSSLSAMTTIKAIAVKSGWNDSPVASATLTIPSGVSGGTVTLFDYEDHNWTYYKGIDASVDGGNYNTNYAGKLYSPNPRNVKITYNGVNGITNSTTTVKVSVDNDEDETSFVYYKTLEQGSTTGEYPYQVISNPFSVRPSTGTGNSKVYYGFAGWKIVSGGEYIKNHNDNDVLALDEEIVFNNLPYTSVNCTSAEIVFETTWKTANRTYVSSNPGSNQTYNTSGDYESNFYVINCNYTRTITTSGPVTIMMVEPDGSADYRNSYAFTGNITPNNNGVTKIEFTQWNSTNTVNANFRNLWIGRGMTTTSQCATLITGLNTTDQTAGTKFSIKVESGKYDYFDFYKGHSTYTGGTANTTATITGTSANAIITIGNDYDRAKASTNNQNLEFKYGPMLGYSCAFNSRDNRDNTHTLDLTIKSGRIGYTFFMENTTTATYLQGGAGYCMYLSSAGSQTNVGTRNVLIEGGDICTIGGGIDSYNNAPSNNNTPSSTTSYNRLSFNVRIKGGTIHGNVYGGAAKSPSGGNRVMVMTGGQVKGWFAAGCNGTDNDGGQNYGTSWVYIGGKAKVDSEGSTKVLGYANGGNVYAAGAGRQGATTCGEMTFGSNLVIADESYIERGAYGGGNYGYSLVSTKIYITGGINGGNDGSVNSVTTKGGVFGGANQQDGPAINLYMTGGEMRGGVYGGCNTQGTISGNVTMQINGGQVGTGTGSGQTANIHGGGYGSETRVSQNVELTLGTNTQTTPGVTVYGDVYGGSALGYVNGTTAGTTYHTYVKMYKGIINGSLYGGGLGDASTAANVYGPVQVKVYGGSVRKTDSNGANGSGGVYGANNVNGAPQRAVTVDIYGTDPAPSANEYALFAVYGGGNKADYTYGNGYPQVTVHNCDNSIEYVYGGGNAAAVAATDVTIYGGNVIGNVFGGGNGTVTAANVTNNTLVKIYGGNILKVFGGSNSQGSIGGTITVNAVSQGKEGAVACPMLVDELYGGGNKAASNVGSISIGCMGDNDMINYVYGGANQADITGSINLLMSGGRIGNLFGGNNTSGNISGTITVTVNWDGSCDNNYLGNVFGGGNLATIGTAGSPKAPTVNILNGTVSGNVFGGGKGLDSDHTKGQVTGNPVVTIGDNVEGHTAIVTGDVYGGGDAGNVVGTPHVNIVNKCNTTISGDVYGGGNAADVNGTDVNIDGGIITGMVFGGGHGDKSTNPQKEANVNGNVAVDVTGGSINKVFGGSNSKGTISGTVAVKIAKASTSCDMHINEVYGGGNQADGNAGTITIECTGDYETNGEGIGDVYGGANAADINNSINLTIKGGHIDRVFGGNNTSGSISGTVAVNVNWSDALTCDKYLGNVFGGGNLAAYTGSPTVTLTNGTVSHSVYGGGNEAGVGGSTVNINGGQVIDGVYGGCNTSGTVTGAIAVNINGGTLGTSSTSMTKGIFGGGYGSLTATEGNVTVTIGSEDGTNVPTIYADIYGGSALGNVNNEATDITTVNFLNGTLHGNLYGGGLGDRASLGSGHADVPAKVNGKVQVNISNNDQTAANCHIDLRDASIYGCNNTNGSPQADVEVNIYKTAYNFSDYLTGNKYKTSYQPGEGDPAPAYAIDQVFGGGNQADYAPENGLASSTKTAQVNIIGCDNTIRRVFGGGNAAASTGVATEINGGRFDYIFGGGNGEEKAANIGAGGVTLTVNAGIINHLFGGSNTNGTISGEMNVTISNSTGCVEDITEFFGGGNLADITGNITTTIECSDPAVKIDNVYGGSNLANITGDVTLIVEGGNLINVFGGSKGRLADNSDPNNPIPAKAANISGDVTLTLYGGTMTNAFGGSNINGNIGGKITVNMEDKGSCALSVVNVYGGGKDAAYTPTTPGSYPEVNIKNGTATGNVYGGGLGATAIVTSDPKVTIGDVTNASYVAIVSGDVYGGGDAAAVDGSTTVIYNDNNVSSTVTNLFGGGNAASVSGGTTVNMTSGKVTAGIYGGCNASGSVGDVTIALNGGNVGANGSGNAADVYGGGFGHSTSTTGDIDITLSGTGTTIYGNLYGGSALGSVGASGKTTTITISASTLHGTIFGGGMGSGSGDATRATTNGNVEINYNTANAYLTGLYGGANVNGLVVGNIEVNVNASVGTDANNTINVFGGGLGENTSTNGNITVNVGDGSNTPIIFGAIYGGSALGSVNDAVADNTTVNVMSGTINGNIYGGGLGQANVYSGETLETDNSAKGQVNGSVIVNIGSGTVNQETGFATTTSGSATINGSVFGCNNTNGSPKGDVTVNVYATAHNTTNDVDYTIDDGANGDPTYAIYEVFGGGNLADYTPTATTSRAIVHVYGCDNTIRRVFGGGNAAAAYGVRTVIDGGRFGYVYGGGNGEVEPADIGAGGTDLKVHGGNIAQLYGGSNTSGSITGSMGISIDATGACATDMYIAEFFCGSNEANIDSDIDATIGCGTHFGDVYGGCNLADVTGNVTLTIEGGVIDNNVYAGSKGSNSQSADISGDVTLNIYGGYISGNAFGGSNVNGNIGGKITVNMDWTQASSNCNASSNLHVTNVYGASNLASYTPDTPGSYPEVNIWHGIVSGNVYGGGLGATAIVTSNPTVTIGDLTEGHETSHVAEVVGDVYGGGDAAGVTGNTSVTIQKGNTAIRNAYGGGNEAAITGTTTLTMAGGTTGNLYGGGNSAGVTSTATVNMDGGAVSTGIYGGCNSNGTVGGAIAVNVNGGTVGTDATTTVNVYGGGYGASTDTGGNVTVTIGNGTSTPVIWGDVYGGSALGSVNDAAAEITKVWLKSGTVNGCLYGGGLGQYSDDNDSSNDIAALVTGEVQVVVAGGSATNVFGCNNLYGSPQSTVTVNIDGGAVANAYGGGNLAAYSGTGGVAVYMNGNGTAGNIFGGGLGSSAVVTGNTTVDISGGTVSTNVYGGGQEADVTGNVSVTVRGTVATTRVNGDVYGGGALADTNTANWNDGTGILSYDWSEVTGLTAGTSSVTGLYLYDSGTGTYTEVTDEAAKAEAGKSYYTNNRKTTVNLLGGLIGNAYGGGLGRAARVASGDDPAIEAVEAMVYGDVTVNVSGAAFVIAGQNRTYHDSETNKDETVWVPTSGSVFGANNIKGTPKGTIRVNVYGTSRADGRPIHLLAKDDPDNQYELYAVYGGGNLANYIPVVVGGDYAKDTKVLVQGCSDTSVNYVYGGGNSASVPQTSVTIDGSFEVGFVFGGGNGNDPILDSDGVTWVQNQGADVKKINGTAGIGAITATRGMIHWVYGGSNKRGLCGEITQTLLTAGDPSCPLRITNVYGAGRNADVESVDIVIKCPGNTVDEAYAGSLNAKIKGDVRMTIIGGAFRNVFGGNDAGGSIGGKIEINVQETSDCQPIIIDNLYGGGNDAAYPNTANADPKITVNIKSCTRIGNIYGGGRGSKAIVSAPTEVNINMVHGYWAGSSTTLSILPEELEKPWSEYTAAEIKEIVEKVSPNLTVTSVDMEAKTCVCTIKNEIGTIGNVYGGGDAAVVNGNATVNIGTETSVRIMRHNGDGVPVNADGVAVYDADGNLRTDIDDTEIAYDEPDALGAHITGNVYGGGNRASVTGSTFVNIGATNLVAVPATGAYTFDAVNLFVPDPEDATKNIAEGVKIQGTEWQYGVFGGGNKGDVLGNSYVNLGAGSVMQSVYGGGCEADVKGNTYVTMLGGYVDDGVYGGGLKGSVGTFTRTTTGHASHADCVGGKPDKWERATAGTTSTASATGRNTGTCTVVISGGQVGPSAAADDGMNADEIIDYGFVFGAGRGEVLDPASDPDVDFHCYVYDTDVTISGGLIMASVYGGGENGRVRNNTLVKIQGGQIGCGNGQIGKDGKPKPYTTPDWTEAEEAVSSGDATRINAIAAKMPECSYWPYGLDTNKDGVKEYEPYDPYADDAPSLYPGGSTAHPSDGKTYYGCVFGGGSGYFPYEKTKSGDVVTDYDWLRSAGLVEGNTEVQITGGHILTNVYGGNEYTDVLGTCTVTMTGGTIGVPRTLEQIAAHPVTCYLFGAGKGDQRDHFSTWTTVNSVVVNVEGGIIYGSVFGGGEEGNVVGNATVNIKEGAKIGTWGTSYVDGNVFGGGRGFSGSLIVGGNVGGNVAVNITGGTMLGSIYGGGRLASVGYKLVNPKLADGTTPNPDYGVMQEDGEHGHGHVTINISGGTIGNDYEYAYIAPNVTGTDLTTAKANMPNTVHDSRNQLTHTKGGNVYAGGMGRRTDLSGAVLSDWQKLGCVKSTNLTITGGTIKSNVYGGGEFGAVTGIHTASEKDYGTEIAISGGTIGTAIGTGSNLYYFGSVFGAGMGDETYGGGDVIKHTSVSIQTGADVKKDVFGGGEFGHVGENVVVEMTGGSVGNNLYGGGAFADTNTSNWDASANSGAGGWAAGMTSGSNTTYVHLTGGTIKHDAYGGGLGQWGVGTRAPKVYGDVHVDLNGAEPSPGLSTPIAASSKGCIVERVFGCNDQNGTPKGHAKVHVHATQNELKDDIADKFAKRGVDLSGIDNVATLKTRLQEFVEVAQKLSIDVTDYQTLIGNASATAEALHTAITAITTAINTASDTPEGAAIVRSTVYDVQAVYGGGDLAAYEPKNTNEYCEVIIDGCDYSSIYHVYGGSNAAPAPATRVRVNATYEIHELFGGGNGKDNYEIDGVYYENPGANVGYHNYTYYVTSDDANYSLATHGEGTLANPYKALDKADASTKELRQTNYRYGTGVSNAEVAGGRIHYAYGGSNHKGNIATTSLSVYESMDDECPLMVDETYGAGKDAPQDGEIDMAMDCVRNMEEIFGGAKNADVNADVKLTITNGSHFKRVFGGNNTSGAIAGSITVEIRESGCEPIKIEELYAGGYLAPYSIYGYEKGGDGNYTLPTGYTYDSERIPLTKASFETYKATLRSAMSADLEALGVAANASQATIDAAIAAALTGSDETNRQKALEYMACKDDLTSYPKKEPLINVISATRIDNIYGGGYKALVVGSPHINVNMTTGRMLVTNTGTAESPVYKDVNGETHDASGVTSETIEGVTRYYVPLALGTIGNIYGGGNQADIDGDTYVEIGTGKWINRDGKWETEDASGTYTYEDRSDSDPANWKSKWNEDMTTGDWKWYDANGNVATPGTARNAAQIKQETDRGGEGIVYGGGNRGDVTGNTYVTMANGYVYNRVFGGGNLGHVGTIDTRTLPEGHASHDGCVEGKPTSFATNTGKSTVTVTGGYVGPFTVSGSVATPKPMVMPDDYGYVFGAGRGDLADPAVDTDIEFTAYVDNTEVTINGTALIAGGVYGGSENGRVLHDTRVYIQGGQIGLGDKLTAAYTEPLWEAAETAVKSANYASIDAAVLTECNAWAYGKIYEGKTAKEWLPYDPRATESTPDARPSGSDGHTFYGNVFGGGSGFFTYEKSGGGYEWLPSAGLVEGDTYLEISGGHILTSAYGGNEMSDVTGTCHVKMTGGTLGVPRTLAQIADHPVTCYLFGGGKGDPRDHFNSRTNVGKAEVEVSGGIIYGSVFGGGEDGHVLGDAIVTIKDTKDESDNVIASPWIGTWGTSYVDGNVFGAGRGFSGLALTAGSVGGNAKVNISGGRMLGSIYGGGRMAAVGVLFADRTILDNNNNPIPNPDYGLLHDDVADDPETSGVDEAKAYGHVTVDISGGTIGNDLEFIPVPRKKKTEADFDLSAWKAEKHIPNTDFYLGKDDNDDDLYLLRHTKGGNVFGGSMGRNTFLDGSINPLWPKLAVVKLTEVTIRGTANIKGNVYGGGEFGVVRNRATVNVKGGTIQGDVYGGGYGSDDDSDASRVAITAGGYSSIPTNYYTFTPMIWNGCVSGNTFVNISGGWVKRNVYGGGEMASVGLINYNSDAAGNYNYITKHDDEFNNFVLSWPYEFQYIAAAPMDLESVGGGVTAVGGKTTVNITGGRIGITGKDYTGPDDISDIINSGTTTEDEKDARRTDNGDVFGGSKGIPENDRYRTAFSSNVKETEVKINYPSDNAAAPDNYKDTPDEGKTYTYDCIAGSVYGGGEDGHVIEDSHVHLTKGLVGHAIYGGGKGKTKFKTTLLKEGASAYLKSGGDRNKVEDYTNEEYKYEADVYGFISGKVYGNTHVEMTDGYVVRNIYGGGNMASVGKGNYAGGADDYFTFGYGELTSIPPNIMAVNLWTPSEGFNPQAPITASNKPTTMADYFLCSGKTSVTVKGGQVGYIQTSNPSKSVKDDLPYGNIFGGCRGESTPNSNEIPPYLYNPTFYAGFVNETEVTVGTDGASTGPKIYGSVYGGGQDGHVRRDTHVKVYSGEIGIPYTTENQGLVQTADLDNLQWLHRGNVYGSGSGIGQYKYDYNYDGDYDDEVDGKAETGYGQSAGSVTRFSQVDIFGGTIHRNVYGGGSQSSVGPPDSGLGPYNVWTKGDTNPAHNGPGWQSQNTVNIYGTIGSPTYNEVYGGEVYGGSRGNASLSNDFSTSVWTLVHIKNGAFVKGNVFGGGDAGKVKKDTDVKIGGE